MKINSINVTPDHEEFNEIESFIEELEKLRYKLYDVENKTNELKEILYEKAKNKPQR